jgi:hypothetical protein
VELSDRRRLPASRILTRSRPRDTPHRLRPPDHRGSRATLAALRVTHESALQLTLLTAALSGRDEAGVASADERSALDVLIPVTKLLTGRQAVAGMSESIEAFGGAGYVEDTHLPTLLRDAHVLPMWEGTTDVLALDALRSQVRSSALEALVRVVGARAALLEHSAVEPATLEAARAGTQTLDCALRWLGDADDDTARQSARRLALTVGRALQAVELALQADHDLRVSGPSRARRRASSRRKRSRPAPQHLASRPCGCRIARDSLAARPIALIFMKLCASNLMTNK